MKNGSFKCRFSSRDTWYLIRQAIPICEWYESVWFPNSTPKYSFLTWIVLKNRLATGDRLVKWNVGANGGCVFCQDQEVETRDHLFFSCPYSSQVWSALSCGILSHRFPSKWDSIIPLLTDSSSPRLHLFVSRYTFHTTIHGLWLERNRRRHGKVPNPSSNLIRSIYKKICNRLSTLAN